MTALPLLLFGPYHSSTLMTALPTMTATERSPLLFTANSDLASLTFQDLLHANGILHFDNQVIKATNLGKIHYQSDLEIKPACSIAMVCLKSQDYICTSLNV